MDDARVLREGRPVLELRIEAATFTCAAGHVWRVERREILASPDAAETCAVCQAPAVDCDVQWSAGVETRGVVLRFPAPAP